MNQKTNLLIEKLKDARSKKVIFVSHCILNENVRYLGGAFRKGSINEIIGSLKKQGIGIVQMRCPEQKAWGGVLKKYGLPLYGLKSSLPIAYKFRKLFLSAFIWYTKKVYQKIAKEVVEEIDDYVASGFEVVGIMGIDGSPSCGVNKILDFNKSLEFIAPLNIDKLERDKMNEHMYQECLSDGRGIFIEAIKRELEKRDINIRFYSHSLISEMEGKKTNLKL